MSTKSVITNSFSQPLSAFKYVSKNPWVWVYLIVPWILNLIILFVFWFFVFNALQASILGLGFLAGVTGIVSGIISFVLFVLTGFVGILVFYFLATLISSPFNGLMVEAMLGRAGYIKKNNEGLIKSIVKEISRSLKFEGLKIFLIIIFLLGSLLLGLLPVIGIVVATILTYFGNTYLAVVEYYDPVLSSNGYEVRDRFRYVKKNLSGNLGLFLLTGLMIYIPIVNILYIPYAVITATLEYMNSNSRK